MVLNSEQIGEVFDIVDYFTTFFIGQNVGVDTLTKKDRLLLQAFGIDVDKMSSESLIEHAFKFGLLSTAIGDKRTKEMDYGQFKSFLSSGKFLPLSEPEKLALKYVKLQSYNDIKGLGNRMSKDVTHALIETSKSRRLKTERIIRREAQTAIKERNSVVELASKLGEKTKDWSRDFDRIADYIMHDAYQQGIASHLMEQYGEDVEVFYTVYHSACEHCVRTYLIDEKTRQPKIFKLKDVIANGSNIGRKAADYKPSVSPLHPWCRCTMHVKPENSVWDATKQQFVLTRNTYGVKRKSKVKITITNS